MATTTLASKDARINWRVTANNRETLETAAAADKLTLSAWLDRYGMPALIRIATKQPEART